MNNNRLSFPNGFEKTEVRWEKIKIKLAPNVLWLCDGCEALDLSVGATCTKPLLYAVLFFLCVGNNLI